MKSATSAHLSTAYRCLVYILGTPSLHKQVGGTSFPLLWCTADASYSCHDDRRSHFGISMHLGSESGCFNSVSKKSTVVALSSTEAEYISLFETSKLIEWARQFLYDLGFPQLSPTVIYEDNQSTVQMVQNGTDRGRTKHMDVRFHYLRDQLLNHNIQLQYCSTTNMISDVLTKPLPTESFIKLRSPLMGPPTVLRPDPS